MSTKIIPTNRGITANGLDLGHEPPPADMAESELLRLAKENLAYFKPLYEKWMPPVYRYLYHRLGSVQEAEELTAQVFLAVCEKLPEYRHQDYFAAWLFGIAHRRAADFYRKRAPSASLDDFDPADPAPDPLAQAVHAEEIRHLRELICSLPEKDQEYIRLRFVAGLTYNEMAALLKSKEDAVRKYLSRLLIRLQNRLEGSNV
jgi:RNA polymerase sigma-70 factor (ECF subfamily)